MIRPKRASVESQVNLQPFLLGAAITTNDMSHRQSGDSTSNQRFSKRDSGFSDIVSAFPSTSSTRRASWIRDEARNQALSRLSAAADERGPSPVHRSYPHQIASASRRLQALKDATGTRVQTNPSYHSVETAIYTPVQDFDFETHQIKAESARNSTVLDTALQVPVERPISPSRSRSGSRDSFATPLSSPARIASPDQPEQQVLSLNPEKELESEPNLGPLPEIISRSESRASQQHNQPHLDSAFEDNLRRGRSLHSAYKRRSLRLITRPNSSLSLRQPPSAASMTLHKVSSTGQIADIDDTDIDSPDTMFNRHDFGAGDRSSAESIYSEETAATSLAPLPPLQSKGNDSDVQQLEPLAEDDPDSFDLVEPAGQEQVASGVYALEKRADLMFSEAHLQAIFDDSKLLMKFTSFLNLHRPQSIPLLIYYLDALKAVRAIKYANAIAEALDPIQGQDFTKSSPDLTNNTALEQKTKQAFSVLVQEDLPAYIAYLWIHVVSTSIQRRITGTLAPHLREASEGLAETFCLSDPSRKDNPIVFASEEFARTTQYGMTYAIGRNCRFLQGPRTNPLSIKRLAMACAAGKEHNEVFVNYRRDGSPFLNLLMMAPLMDSKGVVRYYIGAQVDVSGLLKGCNELPALESLVEKENGARAASEKGQADMDEFQDLVEMFNSTELDTVRKYGGRMHKEYIDDSDLESLADRRPRVLLKDTSQDILEDDIDRQRESSIPASIKDKINGKLDGVYQHYLLVRPAPSLRILFTSPSLRVPGILQSPFLHRIGGSARVRADLEDALADGRGVTAKVRWLLRADEHGEGDGRPRWIHCTPLLGHSGAVGVWMIVLVEDEGQYPASSTPGGRSRYRTAPPVSNVIGGKDWDKERTTDRRKRDMSRDRSSVMDFELGSTQRATSVPRMPERVTERPPIPNRVSVQRPTSSTPASMERPLSNLNASAERSTSSMPGAITSSAAGPSLDAEPAPSPNVPKKRAGRASFLNLGRSKNSSKQNGDTTPSKSAAITSSSSSGTAPNYSAQHVMSQARSNRSVSTGLGKTTQQFAFDLK